MDKSLNEKDWKQSLDKPKAKYKSDMVMLTEYTNRKLEFGTRQLTWLSGQR